MRCLSLPRFIHRKRIPRTAKVPEGTSYKTQLKRPLHDITGKHDRKYEFFQNKLHSLEHVWTAWQSRAQELASGLSSLGFRHLCVWQEDLSCLIFEANIVHAKVTPQRCVTLCIVGLFWNTSLLVEQELSYVNSIRVHSCPLCCSLLIVCFTALVLLLLIFLAFSFVRSFVRSFALSLPPSLPSSLALPLSLSPSLSLSAVL